MSTPTSLQSNGSWDDVIPGYSRMSKEDQRRKADEWEVAQWEPYIKGYAQMNRYEREVARQEWDHAETLRRQQAQNDHDIAAQERQALIDAHHERLRAREMQREYNRRFQALEAEAKRQEQEGNNLMATFKSRAAKTANPQVSVFDVERAQGGGGSGEVSGTLLTHRGLGGGEKLGKQSRLGKKSLLGG